MRDAIEKALVDVGRALKMHAGGIELVSVDEVEGLVQVRLTGTCAGCGLAVLTMREGVERALCAAVPGIRSVQAVNL